MSATDGLSRRRFLKATGGAAAAATVAGCTDDSDSDGGGGTPTLFETGVDPGDGDTGGTLETINDTITTFDPIAATDTASGRVIRQLFEGLTVYPDGLQQPANQLATNIEVSEDFTTYTVTIKEGVTFHDGSELTVQDFIYAWERLAQSSNSNRAYFVLDSLGVEHETEEGSYVPGSLAVEATGDYEMEINLSGPFHDSLQMLAYTSFAAIPEGIVGDIEGYDGEMSQSEFGTSNPVGTGPFQFVEWVDGDHATVEAYDDYHRDGVPYLDGVNWAIIQEDQPRYTYSTNRNADILRIPTSKYSRDKVTVVEETDSGQELGFYGPLDSGEASGESVRYVRSPTLTTYFIAFNARQTPRPVRKAAAYALNREEVNQSIFKNRYQTAYKLTPPGIYPGGTEAYDTAVEEHYPYGIGETRIDEAKRVMEEAGYGEDDRFDLTINAYKSGAFQQLANGLRDKLTSAYIDISVEPTGFSTIIEKGGKGTLQAYTLGWLADWPAPDNFLQKLAPPRTNVSELGSAASSYTDWDDADTQARRDAEQAWTKIQENQAPTEEAQQIRDEAYVTMERANWEDVILLNVAHAADERLWYPDTHVSPFGAMGPSRQVLDTAWKEGGGE
jgi:peptide/nickel transport system substrate-binding protein